MSPEQFDQRDHDEWHLDYKKYEKSKKIMKILADRKIIPKHAGLEASMNVWKACFEIIDID